jgi:glycosyltransferase involved in cell wall biosynthesis
VRVAVIVPVWNEAAAIGRVLAELPLGVADELLVVDGGSSDGTPAIARAAGATVLNQEGRGYGAACLTGARAASAELLVFLDGDYSDPPAQIGRLIRPIREGRADLVLGSRERGRLERGALPLHARLGNRVAVSLLRLLYRLPVTDLPSFKAVRRDHLLALGIQDLHYGWTAELIARAARSGLRVHEVPIDYRARIGTSKVSGTIGGSVKAGAAILSAVIAVRFMSSAGCSRPRQSVSAQLTSSRLRSSGSKRRTRSRSSSI